MSKTRLLWIAVASILAAVITPKIDPTNWAIIFSSLIVVYELANFLFRKPATTSR